MKNGFAFICGISLLVFISGCTGNEPVKKESENNKATEVDRLEKIVLVIHGGASYPSPGRNNLHRDSIVMGVMKEALLAGREVLKNGGISLDAVQAAIRIMEDSPYFNAGKGAVFTSEGKNELDACIMEGKELKAGSVAGVTTIKNPIDAARLVMDSSGHVMLAGRGAEKFAEKMGMPVMDPSYFFTEDSWNELLKAKAKEKEDISGLKKPEPKNQKFGTVGAVALDKQGTLAAGTSTGGRSNKKWGRIGDSPIIGASTYADNRYCGVSSTGWGEIFIRNCVAHSVVAMMEYKNADVKTASEYVMYEKMKGIEGGIIALDKNGKMNAAFNTPIMNRGYITMEGEPIVLIYK